MAKNKTKNYNKKFAQNSTSCFKRHENVTGLIEVKLEAIGRLDLSGLKWSVQKAVCGDLKSAEHRLEAYIASSEGLLIGK